MTSYEISDIAVSALSVVLSAAVAVLAIWGDWIRHKLSPPKLHIALRSHEGELLKSSMTRYYHIVVSNPQQWAPAKNVVVNLIRIDRTGPGADWQIDYETGPIPLTWQYATFRPGNPDVGRDRYCDLGLIPKDKSFSLCTDFKPDTLNNALESGQRIRAHIVAIADNAVSNELILEIGWDGFWHDSNKEMAKHLTIKDVSKATA